jgi:predicted permease
MTNKLLSLRWAARALRRAPMTKCCLIALLSAGCGIAAALLQDSNSIAHPDLPYENRAELVSPFVRQQGRFSPDIPVRIVQSWAETSGLQSFTPFSYLMGAVYRPGTSVSAMRATVVTAQPDLLHILGAEPIIGRSFDPARPDEEVIVSYPVWVQQFGRDQEAVGKSLLVSGTLCTVIGIMPPGFYFPAEVREATVWTASRNMLTTDTVTTQVVARLRPSVSASVASIELNQLSAMGPKKGLSDQDLLLVEYATALTRRLESSLVTMRTIALLLWMVCCVIATGMLGTRLFSKRQHILLVAWLGGRTWDTISVVLAEIAIICAYAYPIALITSFLVHRKVVNLFLLQAPWLSSSHFTVKAILIASALLLCSACVISFVLIILSWDLVSGRSEAPKSPKRSVRASTVIIILELSLTLLLVQIARDLAFQQSRLQSTILGFNPRGLLVLDLAAASTGKDYEGQLRQYLTVLRAAQQIPWVSDAALATSLPLAQSSNVQIDLSSDGRDTQALLRATSPGLLELEGVNLTKGRSCSSTDSEQAQEVAIINEPFSESYFPELDPLGKTIALGGTERARVVGVMANTRQVDVEQATAPELILCLAQMPRSQLLSSMLSGSTINMLLRSRLPIEAARDQLNRTLSAQVPSVAVSKARDFTSAVDATFANRVTLSILFRWTAAASLIMAFLGLYSLLDYRNQQRARENAIRVALGAQRRDIIAQVIRDALLSLVISLCFGWGLIWMSRRIIGSFFEASQPIHDYSMLLSASVLIASVGLAIALAAWRSFNLVSKPTPLLRSVN